MTEDFPAINPVWDLRRTYNLGGQHVNNFESILRRVLLGMLVCATLNLYGWQSAAAKRPNVLIIYGDDQGSIDLGCFGVQDLQTPHLDRLAAQGLRFTQMYAPAPVCSASRVGLLTGRFPARAGQPGNGPLETAELTIAEAFAGAGYRTGHVGKWHLGTTPEQIPSGQGFDQWFGHLQGCIDNYSHFFYWNGPNRHDLWRNDQEIFRPGQFFPDLMVSACQQFIDDTSSPDSPQNLRGPQATTDDGTATDKQDQPWLLYWAFNAPHYPYQGTTAWLEHYQDLPSPRREYCAFLSTMDERIGEVLALLDERGLTDDTIVIYQPDHGHSTETRAFGGGGNAGPYRGAKFSLFEGGIRVPAVARYPRQWPAGQVREQFATACDWFPTLAEICQVPLPAVMLDGVSLSATLAENAAAPREQFYWQFGSGKRAQWAVRDGDWKLIGNPQDTTLPQSQRTNDGRLPVEYFLVDLRRDPGEQRNLADEHHDVRQRLTAKRAEWLKSFNR
ncbi:sulfatase family protein [Planctomycetaceae bacterium SH139]